MIGLNLALGLFSIVAGLGLLITAFSRGREWGRFAHHAEEASGSVVSAVYGEDGALPTAVTVEYKARDGSVRSLTHAVSNLDAAGDSVLLTLDTGAAVHVLYDPHHPADARLKTDGEPTLSTAFLLIGGFLLFVIGLANFG